MFDKYLSEAQIHKPAEADILARIERELHLSLPGDYKEFMMLTDGMNGRVGQSHVKLWESAIIVNNNMDRLAPEGIVLFGDNGGADVYAFDTRNHDTGESSVVILSTNEGSKAPIPQGSFTSFMERVYTGEQYDYPKEEGEQQMKKHLYINGQWKEALLYTTLRSPYSGEAIAEVAEATVHDAEDAIQAAVEARPLMRAMPAHERASILEKLASLLDQRREEAARLIALEAAKPWKTALAEVDRTVQTYKFAAEEAKRIHGETIPMDAAPGGEGRMAYTLKEPIGVVGAITPFNFPMNLVAHKVGPALASGNTVVLKPAEQTPLSAYFIAELLEEAGLPAGALNVISGDGKTIGDRLVTDPRVNYITFTGSPSVGAQIRSKAGLKRVTLELGSNAAVIIDRDTDIAAVIDRCVSGAFANQGQVCISLQRIYVMDDIYEQFTRAFIEATGKLKIGDPLEEDTDVSALISAKDVQRVLEWINDAVKAGATVALGGHADGGVLEPTILLDVDPEANVSCREVFAPLVLINRVSSVDEAIDQVNHSIYGLQAGIYTRDISKALDAADKLQVGGVMINDIPSFRVDHMPYGGVKKSGTGREGIKYAMEEMLEVKLIVIKR